ncbi:hypothetical protein [Desertimonas flava]|uniref:hypothetical protein n=1 Tax=Desertimonas flava TaxID=2064846 RepID=UPI000E3491E9|nr:hypothetical protein [Desertimonas flava]
MSDSYTYRVGFDADTSGIDDATDAVERLEDRLDELGDTDPSRVTEALETLRALADDAETELQGTVDAVKAIGDALGPAFDQPRVEEMVANLRSMGLTFEDIEAQAKEFADVIERVDQIKLDAVNSGLTNVDGALGRVRASGDQSRSVLANLAGNTAQDLGELGGAVGTLGVGLGQLVEYAVDGNISLSNLAKVAGPMLGVAAAGFAATQAFEAFGTRAERTAEQTAAVADAAIEAAGLLDELENRVSGLEGAAQTSGDAFEQFGASIATALAGEENYGEINKIDEALRAVGLTWEDLGETIAGLERDTESAMPTMRALTEAAGIPPEHIDAVAAMVHNIESLDDAASFLINTWGMEEDAAFALVNQYREQIGALEQLNDVQQDNDWDGYAEKLLSVAAAADPATAALIAAAKAANPEATAGEIWTQITGQIDTAADAARRWADANREIDPTSLTWALIADAANSLREGLEPSETQWQAINAVIEQTGWDLDTVLDKGLEFWEAQRQGADDAKAAIDAMGDSLADIAEGLDAAALRGEAFTAATDGLERMSELTQSIELVSFVDGMNSLGDAVKELRDELGSEDFANLDLVPDSWDEVLNMPEELQPVLQALSGFRDNVQSEMAQAFEAGGAPEVQRWAEDTRRAITDSLTAAGVESDEQIQEILGALNLLPPQVETAIVISNEQQALSILDSIKGVIDGLPPEVQLRIAALSLEDPVAAAQLAIAELEAASPDWEVPVNLKAIVDGLEADIDAIEESEPTVEVGILPVTKQFDDTIGEVTKDRTTKVAVELDTSLAKDGDVFADLKGQTITADLEIGNSGEFERQVDGLVEERTVRVNFVTGTIDLPTAADFQARVGTVRVPMDAYIRHTPRIDGSRLVER